MHLLWNEPFEGSTRLFQNLVNGSLTSESHLKTKDEKVIFLLEKKSIFIQNPKGFKNFVRHLFQGNKQKAIDAAKALFSEEQLREELNWPEVLSEVRPRSDEEIFLRSFGLLNLDRRKTEQSMDRLSAAHKETEQAAKEANEAAKEANRVVSKLGNNMGELMESLVEGNLKEVLNNQGLNIIYLDYQVKEKFKVKDLLEDRELNTFPIVDKNGKTLKVIKRAFDIVAIGENDVVIVEVKTHLRSSDVAEFRQNLSVINLFFPEYDKMRIHGAMGFLRAEEEAIQDAENGHLLLVQVPKAFHAQIINSPGFKPINFAQFQVFSNHLFKESLLGFFQFQNVVLDQLTETNQVHVFKKDNNISQRRSFSAVLEGKSQAVILEQKMLLTHEDIQDFVKALNHSFRFFHTLQNKKIFGALAYEKTSSEEAMKEAEKQGLFLIQVSEKGLQIENSQTFEKRNFNPKMDSRTVH